jgi:hypothetical protein
VRPGVRRPWLGAALLGRKPFTRLAVKRSLAGDLEDASTRISLAVAR